MLYRIKFRIVTVESSEKFVFSVKAGQEFPLDRFFRPILKPDQLAYFRLKVEGDTFVRAIAPDIERNGEPVGTESFRLRPGDILDLRSHNIEIHECAVDNEQREESTKFIDIASTKAPNPAPNITAATVAEQPVFPEAPLPVHSLNAPVLDISEPITSTTIASLPPTPFVPIPEEASNPSPPAQLTEKKKRKIPVSYWAAITASLIFLGGQHDWQSTVSVPNPEEASEHDASTLQVSEKVEIPKVATPVVIAPVPLQPAPVLQAPMQASAPAAAVQVLNRSPASENPQPVAIEQKKPVVDSREIFAAIEDNNLNKVEALIAAGASPDFSLDLRGRTPLIAAAAFGRLTVIRFLVEQKKVNINAIDFEGNTALIWSISNQQKATAKYLLSMGADSSKKREDGEDALSLAKKSHEKSLIALLAASKKKLP